MTAKVESRFVVAHSPDGARAVWVRFTRSGSVSEAWCIAFAGEQYVSLRWPAEWSGAWSASYAHARFHFTLEPALAPSGLLTGPLFFGRWPHRRITLPMPNGVVRGEVETSLGVWSLDGWMASEGFNTGDRWSDNYVWALAPFAGGWFEAVSSRVGPWRTTLTLAALHVDGVTQRFTRLRQPAVHTTAQALTLVADNGAGELFAKIFARDFVSLDYAQPTLGSALVRNAPRADVELRWTPHGGKACEILIPAGAVLEFGGQS